MTFASIPSHKQRLANMCVGVLIALWTSTCTLRGAETAHLPVWVHRVLFLGDSITYAGGYVTDLEAYFITRHSAEGVEFINAGLASETVSGLSEPGHAGGKFPRPDLHERLARVLGQTKPDLVFACYGMNDGIYLPLDPDRFGKFREGMEWLHAAVERAGAHIVHVTPPVYRDVGGTHPEYPSVLDEYSNWLVGRRAAGWTVVDLHTAMQREWDVRRQENPQFIFAKDGVHPDEFGHWVMARAILDHLGAKDVGGVPDVRTALRIDPHGGAILALVAHRQNYLKLAWLSATHHLRPGVPPGLPLPEAERRAAEDEERIIALSPTKLD